MKYEDIIDEMIAQGNFEANFEAEQHLTPTLAPTTMLLAKKLAIPPAVAHNMIHGVNGVKSANGGGTKSGSIDQLIAESFGDLDLVVKRDGATIEASLPYVIFGLNDITSNYASTLKSFLPDGVTVEVTTDSSGNVLFTYKQGLNVDVVTVGFQGNTNYRQFLNSMNANVFKTKYIQYTISDETKLSQYNEMLTLGEISSLGANRSNQLLPRTRRRATDFAKDIIELLMPEQVLTPAYSIVQNIIAVDEFQVGLNVFMSSRSDLNKRVAGMNI